MHERRNFGSWVVVLGCILILLGFSSACLADPGDGDRYPSAHIVVLNDDGDRYPSAHIVVLNDDGDRYPSAYLRKF